MDFPEFKKENVEIFALPRQNQILRWEHGNECKSKLIQEIKDVFNYFVFYYFCFKKIIWEKVLDVF